MLKIAVIVAIVVAAGLAIAQDQETVELRSAVAAEDPGAPEYLSALVAADLVTGNEYEILVNGDQVFPAMLQAIDAARERVSFETYVYEKGQVANWFTAALERAAKRGVDVRVIVDAVGASLMEDGHVERLRAAGCHVVDFNPSQWYGLEELNYRTHRKILVVDGEVGFTGGVGVADFWIGNAQDAAHWRDTHVRMRGPIVRLLEAAFYENFIEGEMTVTPTLSEARAVESADVGVQGCGAPRREHPHSRRERHHRSAGGQIRVARGVRGVAGDWHRDLRVRADDDARQIGRGGRRPEHLWISELRQPVARAERRVERRRLQPRRGGEIPRGFRKGSEGLQAPGAGKLAAQAAAAAGPGALLELLR
jgi:phosphatidylserine/phosphatidylglycerophosphate/cardiolipin synthase-like enzyme